MVKKLTILATTDVHSNVWGYNYESNKEMQEGSMSQIYTYIKKIRSENSNTVLIDNGDMLQGTMLTDDVYNDGWEGDHPLAVTMNIMNYDAMNLGNHEFNFNLDLLKRFERQLRFPMISANTIYRSNNSTVVKPYKIIIRDGIKIGIIGVTTPMVDRWIGDKGEGLKFLSMIETTKSYIKEIKKLVDVIIVMAHSSLNGEIDPSEDAARRIIEGCPEINVLIVGHFHITVNEVIGNTIIGGATDKGREIIHCDLFLDENNKVVEKQLNIKNMVNYKPSEDIRGNLLIKEGHEKVIDFAHGQVFGIAPKDFQPKNEINWIPQGRLQETPIIHLINKVQKLYSKADVSATSLIKEESNIFQGNITYGTICNIYKFNTRLFIVEINGKQLKEYMEWCASAYNQLQLGDVSISFSVDIPSYQHDFFSGISYNIDLTKPKGKRIVDLIYKGKELCNEEIIKLAVSDYCYFTTLKGHGFVSEEPIWKSEKTVKEMLVEYIKEVKILKPELENNWKIVGCDFEHSLRKRLINKVNEGVIEVPYSKSLNILELNKENNI